MNETDITCEKIDSPHILILHLTLRLFAFSLSEGEELKTDTHKYYTLLCHFTDKIKKHKSLLYRKEHQYDAVGTFLGSAHQLCLQNLEEVLKSKEHINLHRKACGDAENLMSEIEQVITRQICAYLDSSTTDTQLDADYCNNHLDQCQKSIWTLLIKQDKQYQIQHTLAENQIDYPRAVLTYTELKSKRYDWVKIKTLYQLLNSVQDKRKLIGALQRFIEATGWMGLLSGCIKLDALDKHLSDFVEYASQELIVPRNNNSKLYNTKAETALMSTNSNSLAGLANKSIQLSSSFQKLQNEEFLTWVYKQVADNVSELKELQNKYGIVILDLPNNTPLLPSSSGMFSKPLEIQSSVPIICISSDLI